MFKPVIELKDRRAHIETLLLGGYEHNSSMLSVLLTNLILSSFDNEYVISSEIPLYYFTKEAEFLKHAKLTDEEAKTVKSLYAKCARRHPHGRTLNYAFLPVFLEKAIELISKLQRDCSDDAPSSRIVTNRSRKA